MRAYLLAFLMPCLFASAAEAQDHAAAEAAFRQGQAAISDGDFDQGITAFRKATELDPSFGKAWHMLGYSLHAAGKLDEALQVHLKATGFRDVAAVATYNVACVYSLKGDKDKAFAWLDKAVGLGFRDRAQLTGDKDFDNIRSDPRFAKLADTLTDVVQAYVVTTARRSARVAYFAAKGSPGQIAIDYSPVEWRDAYDKLIDAPKFVGKQWRFGSDFWTSLDNSMPVTIAGVEIPAGYWYLTITHQGEHRFVLGVHDAAEVRKQHLDPSAAALVQGGIIVPLAHAEVGEPADRLEVAIALDQDQENEKRTEGTLRVRFGRHELTAPVRIHLAP